MTQSKTDDIGVSVESKNSQVLLLLWYKIKFAVKSRQFISSFILMWQCTANGI